MWNVLIIAVRHNDVADGEKSTNSLIPPCFLFSLMDKNLIFFSLLSSQHQICKGESLKWCLR